MEHCPFFIRHKRTDPLSSEYSLLKAVDSLATFMALNGSMLREPQIIGFRSHH